MKPYYEPPKFGNSFQQVHADRPGHQIVSRIEEIIETGGQPA